MMVHMKTKATPDKKRYPGKPDLSAVVRRPLPANFDYAYHANLVARIRAGEIKPHATTEEEFAELLAKLQSVAD